MKKFLIVLLMIVCIPAMATTICADDDVIAIVLDPTVNGTWSGMSDTATSEWGVKYQNGTIWGISACIDTPGTNGETVTDLHSLDGSPVIGAERTGQHCWCKITHPTVSAWVYAFSTKSIDSCSGNNGSCPGFCARYTSDIALTGSIHKFIFNAFLYK